MKKLCRPIFALVSVLALAGVVSAQVITDPPTGGGTTTIVSGTTPITGGGTTQLCFNDAAFISCGDAGLTYNKTTDFLSVSGGIITGSVSTAGRSILTIRDTISGGSTTSNFLNITGAMPATLTTETSGALLAIAGSGGSQISSGLSILMTGNTAGGFPSYGLKAENQETGTYTIGVKGLGNAGASTAVGVIGQSTGATNKIGGYFALANQDPPSTSAALVIDNVAVAANVFEARDNGTATSTTAASANVTILDGAQMRLGNQALTSATMTPTIVSEARTVTHSYAWTNAMVVALGAALTGDITVATLPAKTQINNAYVVIDTAAGGPTTLTVSCGDAIGGTPFINYIVPSDAKAAANTVYGDAVAERGTAIDVEFYYVPSYTATTLVTCHFIATVANLNTTTTSTGRLILTTTLLP